MAGHMVCTFTSLGGRLSSVKCDKVDFVEFRIGSYRFSEDWLTTIGFAYLKYELDASVFHERSRDGTSPEQTYNFGGDGEGKTLSLAFVYGRRVYLTFGVQASDVSLPITGQRRDVLGFLRLGGGPVPD